MKTLLIWLFAVTLMLGVGCKKEELSNIKVEQKKSDLPPLNGPTTPIIGDNPFGLPPNAHAGIPTTMAHLPIQGFCNGLSEYEMQGNGPGRPIARCNRQ